MEKEFEINDIVTVDRYNHIDDVDKGTIIGYQKTFNGTLLYRVDIRGVEIQTTGGSIMESKDYKPVPDNQRHDKR